MNPDPESAVSNPLELPTAEIEAQHLIQTPPSDENPEPKSRPSIRASTLLSVTIIVVIAVALTLFFLLYTPHHHHPPSPGYNNCGTTPEEARQRGCTFDILSFAWVLEPCHDAELTAEFLSLDEWQWFTEFNGTETVPRDVVAAGKLDV